MMPSDEGPQVVAPTTAGSSVPGKTTLLMYACSQGDLQQVKRILRDQPTSAVQRDRTLKTALHYCAGGNPKPAPNYSSTVKSDYTLTNVNNNIIPGGEPGLAHCADLLVMAAPTLVDTRDADGFTPLHLAVISGNMQLVNFLLANGADINALDAEKHSVVHWATVCGETGALGAVLGAGAQVSTPDVHGGYPLHYAAQMCGSEKPELGLQVLHILLSQPSVPVTVEDNDGRQPLLWAASAGSARAVLALVRAGATVEASDKDGLTALHCAASRGHTDTLDTLLTLCGATPDVIDTNGCTALHYSVTLGHADATALLLSHGADPNRQDRKGRSPAHCGCAKGQLETVRQLGGHSANLWLRNARGDLPLHEAAASGRRPLVRWLLDQRPSQVNARNNDGRCALHLAALNDNADMCKILLDAGAQVNPILRTSKNVFMTPLDCALQRGFRSTAKFLQLHGGVPASRLSSTATPSAASHLGSASNIHIREDVTVFGGSSSETDQEVAAKKDSRPRRRTTRKRQKVRVDLSASDREDAYRTNRDKSETSVNRDTKTKTKSRSHNRLDVRDRDSPAKSNKQKLGSGSEETDLTSPESKCATSKRDKSVFRDKSRTRQKEDSKREFSQDEKKPIPLDRKKSKKTQQQDEEREISDNNIKDNKKTPKSIDSCAEKASKKVTKESSEQHTLSDSNGKLSKKSDLSDNDKKVANGESKSSRSKSKTKSDSSSKEQQEHHESKKAKEELIHKGKEEISEKVESVVVETKEENNLEQKTSETLGIPEDDHKKQSKEDLSAQTVQPDQISIQSKLSEESPSKTILVEAAVHPLPKGISPEDLSEEQQKASEENVEVNQEIVNETVQEKRDTQEDKTDELAKNEVVKDENKSAEELNVKIEEHAETELKSEEIKAKTNDVSETLPKIGETKKEEVEEAVTAKVENKETQQKNETNKDKIEHKEDEVDKLQEPHSIPEDKQNEEATIKNNTADILEKKDEAKQELNIDLSLKKFEESAGFHEPDTEEEENSMLKTETISESKSDESKQKKYRKKVSKNQVDGTKTNEAKPGEERFSSTSREGSSTESETENKKSKADRKEHKSFKILKEDVAFEVLNDTTTPKESRRVKHKSKKRLKEIERLNESATSSPEMLESIRSRRKSRERGDKESKSVQLLDNLTLPALPEQHKRPESNLSAPNLSSIYSDYEHKSGSNSDVEGDRSTSKRRFSRRRKARLGSKSAGSDYESSNLIDSGFEPSPRSSRIPKRKVMSERGVNMTSVTQQIQTNIRKYHMERKIFQHLLDLKRLQIRSGQANEAMLVKRAIDTYHNSVSATVGAGRYTKKDFTYRSFEQFLYQSLRMLQKSPSDSMRGLPETPDNPLLCTQSTHRCLHATHAYTGIPCAAYLPKMNHHTMPKIGFTPRSTPSFLPQINSKGKSVTLELCHGNDKQVISLPADRLDHNKRYYVTFTVKGQDAPSPTTDQDTTTTTHRHAKSV